MTVFYNDDRALVVEEDGRVGLTLEGPEGDALTEYWHHEDAIQLAYAVLAAALDARLVATNTHSPNEVES